MFSLEEQVAATQAFEQAVADNGWVLCRNEGTVEEAVRQLVCEIHAASQRIHKAIG